MLDITKIFPEESFTGNLFCLLVFFVLLIISHGRHRHHRAEGLRGRSGSGARRNLRAKRLAGRRSPQQRPRLQAVKKNVYTRKGLAMWFLCAVFVVFAFWGGDYYHYAEIITEMSDSQFDYMVVLNQNHMETPYWILAHFCNYNYLVFRFIVWCGALALLWSLCRFLSIGSAPFMFFFVPMALLSFSGPRMCLAEVIALWGWYLLIRHWDRKGFSLVLFFVSLVLIFMSTFFHKSSFFFAAVLVLSVMIDLDIKKLRLLLASLPVMVLIVSTVIVPFLMGHDVSDEGLINYRSAQSYLDKGVISYGIPTWISLILTFIGNGLIGIFVYKSVKRGDYNHWPLVIRKTANVVFYTFILSVPFLFLSSTYSMFYRFIAFMLVPTVLLLASLRQEGYRNKGSGKIALLFTITSLYTLGLGLLGKII